MSTYRALRDLEERIEENQRKALEEKRFERYQALHEIREELKQISTNASWEEFPEDMGR